MAEVDELDVNPFFRSLQTTHKNLYKEVQDNGYILCVPQTTSLIELTFSVKFIASHILKPSPYFKGEYFLLSSDKISVHLDEKRKEFVTGEGYEGKHHIKIINEEQGYSQDYKPFRILVIDKPFDSMYRTSNNQKRNSIEISPQKITFAECKEFLQSFGEYKMVLRHLEDSVNQFNTSYMVLEDYLDDALEKLQSIATNATEKCFKCSKHKLWQDMSFRDDLSSCIESYIMGNVHQTIFKVLHKKFATDDEKLLKKCKQLQDVKVEQLGVPPEFSCPLPLAVVEMANLGGLKTPHEKLSCLKATVDHITGTIQNFIIENQPPGLTDLPVITSDDLIPLLVSVIAQAKCIDLASNMFYMEFFHWTTPTNDRDNLSYCMVTVKAAVEYMKHANFDHLQNTKSKVQKEISIDDLMKRTRDTSLKDDIRNVKVETVQERFRKNSSSNIDNKLDSISKVLEESSEEWAQTKQKGPNSIFGESYQQLKKTVPDIVPPQDPRRKKEQLGDFLSSLQDDPFDMSFGKQS
ncbi:ankyrin repeat domain-containing protein 27-like [Mytilus galloprovincialis]|uniref:ankyrin repeat domain-containing protein 27-like n=1 Tax=Mytilus galloprovincialis TaxID=29158 RepID=UPI003F7B3A14